LTPVRSSKQHSNCGVSVIVKARELGACHVLGKTMVLTKGDVDALLEATRVRPLTPLPREPWSAPPPLPQARISATRKLGRHGP
jgi:hypothetical protein